MELLDPVCPLHGPGIDPSSLVGSQLVGVLASWHTHGERPADGPVEVWLIDDHGGSTNIASGTDWCLVVESSGPDDGFDMGDWGRIDVRPVRDETPFAAHLGEVVLGFRQEWEPATGRVALELEDRVLPVAAYWRTNLTLRQLAPLFGVSKPAAGRVIDHVGPMLALKPRCRFRRGTVLIVEGTLVPTRDHTIAEQSKNYRYSTHHQVVIDARTRLVVAVGKPLPGNRNDCTAWEESGAKAAVGRTTTIADGGYPGTGLVIPHRRPRGGELTEWQAEHNREHKRVRARVEHVFARMKTWKILRDCRLKGDGVHHAMLGIARLYNLLMGTEDGGPLTTSWAKSPFLETVAVGFTSAVIS